MTMRLRQLASRAFFQPVARVFQPVARAMERHPVVLGGGGLLAVRYGAGDLLMQYLEHRHAIRDGDKNDTPWRIQWTRLAVLSCFGFFYGAGPG